MYKPLIKLNINIDKIFNTELVVFPIILWELSQTDHGFYHFYSHWINYLIQFMEYL